MTQVPTVLRVVCARFDRLIADLPWYLRMGNDLEQARVTMSDAQRAKILEAANAVMIGSTRCCVPFRFAELSQFFAKQPAITHGHYHLTRCALYHLGGYLVSAHRTNAISSLCINLSLCSGESEHTSSDGDGLGVSYTSAINEILRVAGPRLRTLRINGSNAVSDNEDVTIDPRFMSVRCENLVSLAVKMPPPDTESPEFYYMSSLAVCIAQSAKALRTIEITGHVSRNRVRQLCASPYPMRSLRRLCISQLDTLDNSEDFGAIHARDLFAQVRSDCLTSLIEIGVGNIGRTVIDSIPPWIQWLRIYHGEPCDVLALCNRLRQTTFLPCLGYLRVRVNLRSRRTQGQRRLPQRLAEVCKARGVRLVMLPHKFLKSAKSKASKGVDILLDHLEESMRYLYPEPIETAQPPAPMHFGTIPAAMWYQMLG